MVLAGEREKKEEYAKPRTEGREASYGKIELRTVAVNQDNNHRGFGLWTITTEALDNKKALALILKPAIPTPSNTELARSFQRDTEKGIVVLPHCEVLQRDRSSRTTAVPAVLLQNESTFINLSGLLLLSLLLLKKVGSARLRQSGIHPISPKTPAPQYQSIDRKKRKGKGVEDHSRERAA